MTTEKTTINNQDKRTLGICMGASTLSVVDARRDAGEITFEPIVSLPHEGRPAEHLRTVLSNLNLADYSCAFVTGRKFRHAVRLPSISEIEAVEYAITHTGLGGKFDMALSIGGETFIGYVLDNEGRIGTAHGGNKCAAGTGEFFLQQIRRMGLTPKDALDFAQTSEQIHTISGRCSVFCKSDCTHALNAGADRGSIIAGLCKMLSIKMMELVEKCGNTRVVAIGGVTKNNVAMNYLRDKVETLHVPAEATFFEALGAAIAAIESKEPSSVLDIENMLRTGASQFEFLPQLKDHADMVKFRTQPTAKHSENEEECIVGLDVGSTTTKAVLLRLSDDAVLNSVYLRTNGHPVNASRNCYRSLSENLTEKVRIVGLGVTGSGRQIAGLHALTPAVINEIVAHAKAAVFFDADVDTIFEIGGQDAKYTYLTGGVASDYAMNEACAAGTGSFLEEAAGESLGFNVEEIAEAAMTSKKAPSFSDQCSAFISSDIKIAIQEGISREDIVAGLAYSICQNYINRVKGNRPVGNKIFMQGGVCYNRAVPIAMATLTGKEIVVPPDPGLMGAFGVALDVKNKLKLGILKEQIFDLAELAAREVTHLNSFICGGGKNACDHKCEISRFKICGRNYSFGGSCNKYYNLRFEKDVDASKFDMVERHQRIFLENKQTPAQKKTKTIGFNRSFMMHSYFPLFSTFFTELGWSIVFPDTHDPQAIKRRNADFCYPLELAHGFFHTLLQQSVDILFLPHILELPAAGVKQAKHTCVFSQSESYVLRSTFNEELKDKRVLTPLLSFPHGPESARKEFIAMALEIGASRTLAKEAFAAAVQRQKDCEQQIRKETASVVQNLENSKEFGVVIFGRPYNSYAHEANMAIPNKFASRGIYTIPCSALPWEKEEPIPEIYWANGQMLLRTAKYVKRNPNLYAVFVTNFSCGPDSFLLTFLRDIMGSKPSLTLELDSQTADAGVTTRIEAFLDVVNSYSEMQANVLTPETPKTPDTPTVHLKGRRTRVETKGKTYHLDDLHIIYPSMGQFTGTAVEAFTRRQGIKATTLPTPDAEDLKTGKANASCKECLPLILTTGSFLNYINRRNDADEFTMLFMPKQIDPCRLCVYSTYITRVLDRNQTENVAVLSLTDEDGYQGLGQRYARAMVKAFTIGDVAEDAHNTLMALAEDTTTAKNIFVTEWQKVLACAEQGNVMRALSNMAATLKEIPLRHAPHKAPKVLITGEIYVRKDDFSRQRLVARLAKRGIIATVTPASEALHYMNYMTRHGVDRGSLTRRLEAMAEYAYMLHIERNVQNAMMPSGLIDPEMIKVEETLNHADHLVGKHIKGELSLSVGAALREIKSRVDGVILIGPFGCMPSRVASSILADEMTFTGKKRTSDATTDNDKKQQPFLSIESDGSTFPQVLDARLDAFCLQVERANAKQQNIKSHTKEG